MNVKNVSENKRIERALSKFFIVIVFKEIHWTPWNLLKMVQPLLTEA